MKYCMYICHLFDVDRDSCTGCLVPWQVLSNQMDIFCPVVREEIKGCQASNS